MRVENRTRQVCLGDRIGIADTSEKRRTGLLKHTHLDEGEGLWIAPCEAIHCIGMKFPIDVLFLSKKRQVLKLKENLRPWRLAICLRAHSVLELPAGTIRRTGTVRGDQLEFEK